MWWTIVCQPEYPMCGQSSVHTHCCPDSFLRSPVMHLAMPRKTPPPFWDYSLQDYIVNRIYNSVYNPILPLVPALWYPSFELVWANCALDICDTLGTDPLFFYRISSRDLTIFGLCPFHNAPLFNSAATCGRRAFQMPL